jgi:putative cell wall-binding protein
VKARAGRLLIALAALVAVGWPDTGAVAASASPQWSPTPIASGFTPADPGDLSTAFDAATGQLVAVGMDASPYFADFNLLGCESDSVGTWTFDGADWASHEPAGAPRARGRSALAYDPSTRQVVMFGGSAAPCSASPTGPPTTTPGSFADTWTWNGSIWSQQHPATSPPAAGGGCAAYDATTSQLIMYGGETPSAGSPTVYRAATWQWTGSAWVQLPTSTAPPGGNCTMTYDATTGTIVMLVRSDPATDGSTVQTWVWTGTSWTRAADVPGEISRYPIGLPTFYGATEPPLMAFDPVTGQALAWLNIGAPSNTQPTADQLWAWDGSTWSRQVAANEPNLGGTVFGYDDATGQLVLFGRTLASVQSETYAVPGSTTIAPTRVSGADRQSTAVAASQDAFATAGAAGAVVLARADVFADALAGGPLAAANHGPLLLTSSGVLDPVTKAEIVRVLPIGGTVYLLGGTSALSDSVAAAVVALGDKPVRIAGADRYSTAIAIAGALGNPGTVFEASGLNFPDALSAVPAAVVDHGAIVLTDGSSQAAVTAAYLAAHPGNHFAIGGPAAWADPAAIAFAGVDRYATSAAVALAFFPNAAAVSIASGENFPDALGGGPAAGVAGQPMLLLNNVGTVAEPIAAYLSTHAGQIGAVQVFGGDAALSDVSLSGVARVLTGSYFPPIFGSN